MSVPPPEKFSAQQLKEAREEFRNLKSLLDKCSQLSQGIESGKCDFDEILTCLYEIQKSPMYQFLSAQDPNLKQTVEVVFLRIRSVGGVISLSNQYDEKTKEHLDESMKELDEFIETKKIKEEPGLKRSFAELEGVAEGDEGLMDIKEIE